MEVNHTRPPKGEIVITPAPKPDHVEAYLACLQLVMTAETTEQREKSEQLARDLGQLLSAEQLYRLYRALPPNAGEEVVTANDFVYVHMSGKTYYLDDTTGEALASWWPAYDYSSDPKPCGDGSP